MKKIFSMIGVMTLVCFSFYYTDFATTIIKNNDPIMKKIENVSQEYREESVNAVMQENHIIPGICGLEIDIDKTYESMKKYGSFNEDLIVFKDVIPLISVTNIYDKYITLGNPSKNMVGLVIVLNNSSYLEEILAILQAKNIKATFFISDNLIDNSKDIIKLINNYSHQIEVLSSNYEDVNILNHNKIVKKITDKEIRFCYSDKENQKILDNCSKNNMYTIVPSLITKDFPYSDVKSNLKSGSIIKLDNNDQTLRELKYIINYIKQKGYQIVTLEKLIQE